ncbi:MULTISPECIES: hypothetical protein [Thermomonosporaceae]|uniref:hypothetical protein n=1 Tax=Thermomonosporaceae TaxID=2012 RepID=UPI00255AF7BE|nr:MULTISPECIES: hypothetical protein [Thermomonosporaceae]MDL4775925.1 hypothetical protein [Actinomadura xylanilytica]
MTGWDEEALAVLRAAASAGDGRAGLEVLRGRSLVPVLQHAGDVLVAALAQGAPGAGPHASACLAELDGRGLPGDAELAAELAAALYDPRPRPDLADVPVDPGALAAALEDAPAGGGAHVLDLLRGDVLEAGELDGEPAFDAGDAAYDPGRWLVVPPRPTTGAGFPGEADGTFAREERRRGRARRWLAEHGGRPVPRTL